MKSCPKRSLWTVHQECSRQKKCPTLKKEKLNNLKDNVIKIIMLLFVKQGSKKLQSILTEVQTSLKNHFEWFFGNEELLIHKYYMELDLSTQNSTNPYTQQKKLT